ncbi:hypothetical protein ACHAQH_006233 [Verticillium albo-atrum]
MDTPQYGDWLDPRAPPIGVLSPVSPGWKKALVRPRPGGTIRHAATSFESPIGLYAVSWAIEGSRLKINMVVPPNGEAEVQLPGLKDRVGSGRYDFEVDWVDNTRWPPAAIQGAQGQSMPDEFVP